VILAVQRSRRRVILAGDSGGAAILSDSGRFVQNELCSGKRIMFADRGKENHVC
jgi:hypothetical protein